MPKLNNKSGFTLIEIIVVLIIIGVLVNIALPNLFSNIPRAQGTVALASADAFKTVLETCFGTNSTKTVNTAPCSLTGQNLATNVQGIAITLVDTSGGTGTAANGGLSYQLLGNNGGVFTIDRATNGVYTCASGLGAYSTLC